ncbi:MAG: hypothetical protein ACREPQ_14780 [Rhodanobacter sp.]
MTQSWHTTESASETTSFADDFLRGHRDAIQSGTFWADRIKSLRGEPAQRLRLAIDNLPLPAAFREAAIATRALIKEQRKVGGHYEEQLTLLYWLAAMDSFSIPYSAKSHGPGYNVMQAVPGVVLKGLPFTYGQLGYKHLKLLNPTDIKWLVSAWSEPQAHTTLHDLHLTVWEEYEAQVARHRETLLRNLADALAQAMGSGNAGAHPQLRDS